jgi:hypothetical protein
MGVKINPKRAPTKPTTKAYCSIVKGISVFGLATAAVPRFVPKTTPMIQKTTMPIKRKIKSMLIISLLRKYYDVNVQENNKNNR